MALEQGTLPHILRWFSRRCVDSQANFASAVASLAFALVCARVCPTDLSFVFNFAQTGPWRNSL